MLHMLREEAANTSFIVFSFTQPGIKLTIYATQGEQHNYYTTKAVTIFEAIITITTNIQYIGFSDNICK